MRFCRPPFGGLLGAETPLILIGKKMRARFICAKNARMKIGFIAIVVVRLLMPIIMGEPIYRKTTTTT